MFSPDYKALYFIKEKLWIQPLKLFFLHDIVLQINLLLFMQFSQELFVCSISTTAQPVTVGPAVNVDDCDQSDTQERKVNFKMF